MCLSHNCTAADPYLCVLPGSGDQQCSDMPPPAGHCSLCCNVDSCGPASCSAPCNSTICATPSHCPFNVPYQCTAGTSSGGCSSLPGQWPASGTCTSCCDTTICELTTTAAPMPNCSLSQCENSVKLCGASTPIYCFSGPAAGGCLPVADQNNGACTSGCNTDSCPPPPTPVPHPPSPWDLVPESKNCTFNETPQLAPNPGATPYGGIDVSELGCKAWVSESCCGYTPRFNWILSTCSPNPAERLSMACRHPGANITALKLRYIAAYQWNADKEAWIKDPNSSTPVDKEGNLDLSGWRDGGNSDSRSDWDIKYAPTTQRQGTNGVGPPGYMFVLSAKQLAYAAFFALNQITLNRGPGYQDNCWGSSSGELDFLEVPFWEGIEVPINRWYVTTTADAGRCLPAQKNVPRFLNSRCSSPYCCEMCSCPNGTVCFGNTDNIGFQAMGCINASLPIPNGTVSFDVDGSNVTCGHHFGAVAGGATSNAYFEQDPLHGDVDVIYAIVVDHDGTFVYRWHDSQENVWPGIGANGSLDVLRTRKPQGVRMETPCPPMVSNNSGASTTVSAPCGIWEPSCVDDCPLVSAGGVFGPTQVSGAYAAESARDGLNWWNFFNSTQHASDNITNVKPHQLPHSVEITVIIPQLPYHCNKSCGPAVCQSATHCPYDSPYMCTEGDAFGGCNTNDRFWPLSPYCRECCDVTFCEFNCSVCTREYCEPRPHCGPESPYLCYNGSAAGGCSVNASFWGEQASCDGCCYCPTIPPLTTTIPNTAGSSSSSGDYTSDLPTLTNDIEEMMTSATNGDERRILFVKESNNFAKPVKEKNNNNNNKDNNRHHLKSLFPKP